MAEKIVWESVDSCNYCGSSNFAVYSISSVPKWYAGRPLILKECNDCGLVFASPRPERYAINEGYLSGSADAEGAVERKLSRPNVQDVHLKHVNMALSYFHSEHEGVVRLYDMGCGAGTIMEAAKSLGLEAEGNDINYSAVKRLRNLGFTCYHGFTCDLAELPMDSYDIVINFDYLEHSYEPFDDLMTCNSMLKEGGVLYLKTLYLDCPDHLVKNEGYQLFGCGHFHYFKPRTLVNMIHGAGFDILNIRMGNLIFIVAKKRHRQVIISH